MAIFKKIGDFCSSLSITTSVPEMRKSLMDYFATEGVTCEIKDGELIFEFQECYYTVNFAPGEDYAECAIVFTFSDEKYENLELSDKTYIASKISNEIDNHATLNVYNESFRIASTFYFTSKRMMLELFIRHFEDVNNMMLATIGIITEFIAADRAEVEKEEKSKHIGFVAPDNSADEVQVSAKK